MTTIVQVLRWVIEDMWTVLRVLMRRASMVLFWGLLGLLIFLPAAAVAVLDANLVVMQFLGLITPGFPGTIIDTIVSVVTSLAEFSRNATNNKWVKLDPQVQFALRVVPEYILMWCEAKVLQAIVVGLNILGWAKRALPSNVTPVKGK